MRKWKGVCFASGKDESNGKGYFEDILGTVGNTPLVRLARIGRRAKPLLLAKMECFNPGGSIKDRAAVRMLLDAEEKGLVKKGWTIVEPTSGNTGVGLAMVAARRGYRMIFTMPDRMSAEKELLLRAYGAEVIRTPSGVPSSDARSHVQVAERLARDMPRSFCPNQYANGNNPRAHFETTGPEIWSATRGRITHFVAGIGTGGTISGIGKYLKSKNPGIRIIGVDPAGSVLAEEFEGKMGNHFPYKLEGIGQDFVPKTLNFSVVDMVVRVSDEQAFFTARALAQKEGILAGGSSGAALFAALSLSAGLTKKDVVVVLLPDTGRNYLSTFYNDEWMRQNGFL